MSGHSAQKPLVIATRKSPLALWQANHIAARLRELYRVQRLDVTLLELSTEGDRFLQAPLSQVGGKGLFVKEIEAALQDGRADLAVHSLKDMTSAMPDGLLLACVPEREDPRDAFVGRKARQLEELRQGARVGTSSLRRSCQLLERRPDLQIVPLRGNVQTRLRKLEEQDLDAAVLAAAGLRRLELHAKITQLLDPAQCLPAVGQGALAVQCRTADSRVRELLAPLDHADTRATVAAERAFLAELEGGCSVPMAGHATLEGGGNLRLRGLIGSPNGRRVVRAEKTAKRDQGAVIGRELAKELLSAGGAEILRAHAAPERIPDS